jgi:undecaprenyl pyrophosphate phosphatase UppP
MNWLVALLLGFVEGLTEFLSVSTRTHLPIGDKLPAVTPAGCPGTGIVHAT